MGTPLTSGLLTAVWGSFAAVEVVLLGVFVLLLLGLPLLLPLFVGV